MDNPSLDAMMRQPLADLAMAIRARATRIFDRFRILILEVLPAADELTLSELQNSLPKVLEDLAIALAATGGPRQTNFLADSREHGVCRYHQSFNLSELLVEYSILRSILLEEITRELNRALTVDELRGLNAGIDASARRAVETFVAYQKQEIKSSSEAYSKYLSFLSHDLRGNLNGILLMVEVLRRELSAAKQFKDSLEDLDLMRRSILDTVGTMDRFLHAERFRRGKVEVKWGEVNLSTLIQDVVNQFSAQAREKGIELCIDTTRCPTITTDRELLSMVLQNLISNAVKYTRQGSVRIAAQPMGAGACQISVADEGPGIALEDMADIFQPFTRGKTHGQKGAGLGLSIAKQAADLLGANLCASSGGLGKGATFILDLPARPQLGAAAAKK
ncbi:MAG: HAMP domain-containing histidine kinase [Planctomycetota bacterium]|nr:HAMP domain-containing histidine kinase [Planctomycetota bacterium]